MSQSNVALCNEVRETYPIYPEIGPQSRALRTQLHALCDTADELYEALEIAAKRFREYEKLHLAKYTEEGDLKAANNADLAEHCETVLTKARGGIGL